VCVIHHSIDRFFSALKRYMTCHAIYWQKARIKSKGIGGSDRLTGGCVGQRVKVMLCVLFVSLNIFIAMYVPLSVLCVLSVCKCVLICCHRVSTKCVLNCCHRVSTQSQLTISSPPPPSTVGGSSLLPHSIPFLNFLQSKSWLTYCRHYCDGHRFVFQHKEIPYLHYLGNTHGYDRPRHFVTKYTYFHHTTILQNLITS
jgi:hypothetical protein